MWINWWTAADWEEVGKLRTAVSDHVTYGMLHPGIGDKNPYRRETGRTGHQPDADHMGLRRQLVPPERPDRDKSGLKEEGRGSLYGQKRPKNVPDVS